MSEYDPLKSWSSWIREGHFISYTREQTRLYEHVIGRDFGHWEFDWPEDILPLATSGPVIPQDLEITRGYQENNRTNQIWQMIFGIEGQVYIYVELPTDTERHGIPKVPKPGTTARRVAHFTEWMSPFLEPSFITEHIMLRSETQQIAFEAYNPGTRTFRSGTRDVRLNIFLNKLLTERIGTEEAGAAPVPTIPRWSEVLDKLYRRVIPHRPLSIEGIRAPAVAPTGQ